ncbi:MAG TPA: fatty acyl-AMP ligase [Spirochaetota bacterium]|nr:fatty acyl-AMP ligase [Spirochaetota bacterium]
MKINQKTKIPAHQKNVHEYSVKASTLVDILRGRMKVKQDFLIFMDMKNHEKKISAAEVVARSEMTAQYLMAQGLRKDDKVVIMLPTGEEFVYVYFGTLMAGGVPVPVSQPAGTSNLEKYLGNLKHIIVDCEGKFFITYDKMKMIIGSMVGITSLGTHFLFTNEIFGHAHQTGEKFPLPEIGSEDIALIQYTSGTTGHPKGVLLSHKNLIHNIHGIGVASAMADGDVGISWLPLYHDMGLIGGLFTTMYWNMPIVLMKPEAFLFRPQWWMENIGRYKVTMGVAPNFGYHYCVTRISDEDLHRIDLRTWRLALNGAEPIDRITLQKFIDKFRACGLRDNLFLPVYGMAENSLAATFPALDNTTVVRRFDRQMLEEEHLALDSDSEDSKDFIDLVAVGYPLLGQEIRIADEKGNTMFERQVGEILVKSQSLTIGYYKNTEATNNTIRNGWLYTGDLGFILDGMLFISGRKKEMIIKRGKNIYPYDVERIAATVEGVRLGSCAAFAIENQEEGTEDLVLVCESVIRDKEKIEDLRKAISGEIMARLGFRPDDIRIVPKGTVPKTTSGKLQRVLCKKIYLEDDFIESGIQDKILLFKTVILSYFQLLKKMVSGFFARSRKAV